MQGAALLVSEVITFVVRNQIYNRPLRQTCRLVENEASLFDACSKGAHNHYCTGFTNASQALRLANRTEKTCASSRLANHGNAFVAKVRALPFATGDERKDLLQVPVPYFFSRALLLNNASILRLLLRKAARKQCGLLRAIAKERNLARTTLQHIKSVLSTILIYAKSEGVFDGANPIEGALVPRNARGPCRTHAYDLSQVSQILKVLPLLAKSLVATAAFAGLRRGELRGLEWSDYTARSLTINRSIWRSVVNLPKTRASQASVPVIRQLAQILDEYHRSMGNPQTGVIFHEGEGLPINLDSFTRKIIQPVLKANRIPWYGWHAFRRGLASNLYATGAQDILVQRILRHAKAHVTRDCYIKVFDSTVSAAMERLQVQIQQLEEERSDSRQLEFAFAERFDQQIAIAKSQVRGGFSDLLGG